MGAFFKESAAAANPFTPIATNSAPQSKQIGSASLLHNLLLTTLAAVAIAIPIGKQLSTSAPPPKYQTQVDISPNTLLRGIPQPIPFKTDHFTRPQQRYEVVAEQYTNRLLLGIPKPIPYNFYGFENPKQKYEVIAEQYTNRLLLGIPGPIPYKTYHFTAPQQKWSVVAEQYVNNLVLGLPVNPLPRVPTVFAAVSAKPLGPAEQWPNLTLSTLATTVIPIPQGKVLTDSAPQPKYQIQVDRFPDTLLQGIPQPIPFNLYGFDAAKLKYSVTFDTFPNTVLTGIPQPIPFKTDHFTTPQQKWPVVAEQYQNRLTLGLPAPSIALPQGAQLPTFTAQQKFSVVADQFVNTLILGIPVNPVVRVPIVFASISAKPLGAVEQWPNLLLETLGIKNPLPQGAQLYDSAPPLKAATAPPLFPARGFQPVAVPIPLPLGLPVDVSQWQGKYQLLVDGPPNLVLSTLLQVAVAIPQGKVVSDSAPSQKYQVQVDQPQNLLLSSFLFLKNPAWIDFDPVPFQAQHYETNDPPNLLLTNLASAQPIPIRLNDQPDSPQAKYTVQVDAYPNLNTSTFALPPNPIPIGERGANAWLTQLQQQLKFEVVDVNLLWPNSQLPNTIPAPVITASYRVFGPRTSDKSVHRRNQNSVPFGKVSRDLS
jgi:hypothetical protein